MEMNVTKRNDNTEVHDSLNEIADLWKDTPPARAGRLVDGTYLTKILCMEVCESKNGRLQVATTFCVVDGDYKDKEFMKFDGIKDEQGISYFKSYCEALGVELPDDPSDLQDALHVFVDSFDALVEVVLKTKGEYQNIYVSGVKNVEYDESAIEERVEEPAAPALPAHRNKPISTKKKR